MGPTRILESLPLIKTLPLTLILTKVMNLKKLPAQIHLLLTKPMTQKILSQMTLPLRIAPLDKEFQKRPLETHLTVTALRIGKLRSAAGWSTASRGTRTVSEVQYCQIFNLSPNLIILCVTTVGHKNDNIKRVDIRVIYSKEL